MNLSLTLQREYEDTAGAPPMKCPWKSACWKTKTNKQTNKQTNKNKINKEIKQTNKQKQKTKQQTNPQKTNRQKNLNSLSFFVQASRFIWVRPSAACRTINVTGFLNCSPHGSKRTIGAIINLSATGGWSRSGERMDTDITLGESKAPLGMSRCTISPRLSLMIRNPPSGWIRFETLYKTGSGWLGINGPA